MVMIRRLFCLTQKELNNLKKEADELELSVSELLRRIIDERYNDKK